MAKVVKKGHEKDNIKTNVKIRDFANTKDVEIVPCLYHGKHVGHGKYITGVRKDTNEMVYDENNIPIQWRHI